MHVEALNKLVADIKQKGMSVLVVKINEDISDLRKQLISAKGLHEPKGQALFSERQGSLAALEELVFILNKL
jgi:hypothetical protein